MSGGAPSVVLADTVTRLAGAQGGAVLVTGSHGGVIAARYAAQGTLRAAIFHDAGLGLDEAGVAGLAWLAARGVPAAAVSHRTARVGDAADCLHRGRLSRVNAPAAALGVVPGLRCAEAAARLAQARTTPACAPPFAPGEGRVLLEAGGAGAAEVVGLDSIGLVTPGDAPAVLVLGSHGALHGGDAASALPVDARAAFFHDAGIGCDGAGVSRLPVLAVRGIAAGAVDHRSARIGEARSLWATGVLSRVNAVLAARGVRPGARLQDVARALAAAGGSVPR